jgi:hypothetical protein
MMEFSPRAAELTTPTVTRKQLESFFRILFSSYKSRYFSHNSRGIGAVVFEVENIFTRDRENIHLSDSDILQIQGDLLNGSYSFSPLKEVQSPFDPFSLCILFMIQYWISRRKRLKIEYGVGWQPRGTG